MAKKSQIAQVGKHKVELTNLDKVLYPDDGIVKAEVIDYYLRIAPTILRHIKGRPLSQVRFPDGIEGERFFQKNKPDWAPKWIEHARYGSEKKLDYVIATNDATMVWLANLACLELHQMHSRRPHFDMPDYFVFDLDPPEETSFAEVVQLALDLRPHVESFGYHTFVKTSGQAGIHICVPIEPRWSFNEVFEAARDVAQPFVSANDDRATLHIKKEARKGRILVDVYRNRSSQTIIAPYSLRGRPHAPVSMPLTWDELADLEDPRDHNLRNVVDKVIDDGDPWEAFAAYSVRIHTDRPVTKRKKNKGPSDKHKSPEQLEDYSKKREFSKTPEPGPDVEVGEGNAFVVHRHHASRLHYDLRLEEDGALKSWAVPRGMPPVPGIKRLAVATEDHPLEYINFEGEIPKGQYGGGMMWIFARGKYEKTKIKKDGSFYFTLSSEELNAEYRIFQTNDNNWLLERVDRPQIDWLHDPIEPMLAQLVETVPNPDRYDYELKWDGIRAIVAVDEGNITIHTRNQRDVTEKFPELLDADASFRTASGVFDGEIVCLDDEGRPEFRDVINRIQRRGETSIKRAAGKTPAFCYLFDCLYLDGRSLAGDPIERRREWLHDAVKAGGYYRVSEVVEDGEALFEAVSTMGLEGIVAKERGSTYQPGRRSRKWLKVKVRSSADCVIIGYTVGTKDRTGFFSALHVAEQEDDGSFVYRGRVGTGFNSKTLKSIYKELEQVDTAEMPKWVTMKDKAESVWIEPHLVCEVQYASLTRNGTFREPVFLRMRPDLTI